MTIRNFLPRFGMRTVAALAVAAAVVVAALLAVGSPASAQSSDEKEIWSGTITVGLSSTSSGSARGFHGRGDPTVDYGSLDDDTFTYDGTDYDIEIINDSPAFNGMLVFAVAPQLRALPEKVFRLHIGGRTFDFEDATTVDDAPLRAYQWRNLSPRFGWSDNDTVDVKITERKSISVVGGSDVEYGGNNNAAESTATFAFSRTGNIDEALSFTVKHVQSGETATRKFAAGQASFDNFHWAVDVDESNNPVCLITWEILPVSGYILYLNPAVVLVEGPGTTCMSGM